MAPIPDQSSFKTFLSISNFSLLILTIVLVYKLVQGYRRYRKWESIYDVMPGDPEKHWLWGHVHLYPGPNEAGLKYQLEQTTSYPIFQRLWISRFRPLLLFHHPESVKVLLKTTEPKPRAPGTIYVLGLPWLGEGLLIANGEHWARNRRLLTPAFHFDILQPYTLVYNQAVDVLMNKLDVLATTGESFELFSMIGLLSLDIILRCAFSYRSDCQILGESHPYVQAVNALSDLWVERALRPSMFFDFIYYWTSNGRKFLKHCDYVHSVAEEVIQKRKQTLAEEGLPNDSSTRQSRYLDFLDILLTAKDENEHGLSFLEIRNEVDTFLFEGHDTTTSAMCWTLYSLCQHLDCQNQIQTEVDELLKGRESVYIESKDLQRLEYLTLCIKEGMRYHSPVSFIQRETTKELFLEEKVIPAFTIIAVNIYNLHHNPAVWDNPSEFQPERFLPENSANRDSYSYIPFSAGPRNCIGQHFAMNEMKVTLARLLHRYEFVLDSSHEVRKKIGVVMRSENGIKVRVRRRA